MIAICFKLFHKPKVLGLFRKITSIVHIGLLKLNSQSNFPILGCHDFIFVLSFTVSADLITTTVPYSVFGISKEHIKSEWHGMTLFRQLFILGAIASVLFVLCCASIVLVQHGGEGHAEYLKSERTKLYEENMKLAGIMSDEFEPEGGGGMPGMGGLPSMGAGGMGRGRGGPGGRGRGAMGRGMGIPGGRGMGGMGRGIGVPSGSKGHGKGASKENPKVSAGKSKTLDNESSNSESHRKHKKRKKKKKDISTGSRCSVRT